MAAVISSVEKAFVVQALKQGLRADGRAAIESRKVRFEFSRTDSKAVAQVQFGRTRVMCVTTADIIPPFPDRPAEGFIQFSAEFSRMAGEEFEEGRPSIDSVELGRVVERALKDSRAIDTEALCIMAGEKVWSLKCVMHVLDHGGNLIDACALAAIASLLHFRRADVSVVGEKVTVHTVAERAPVPLSVHHIPVCVTFGILDGVDKLIVDPTDREELVMSGRVTYALNAHSELCVVHKLGGTPVSVDQMLECAHVAAAKAKSIVNLLNKALAAAEVDHEKAARAKHAAAAGFHLAPTPGIDDFDRDDAKAEDAEDKAGIDWLLAHSEASIAHLGAGAGQRAQSKAAKRRARQARAREAKNGGATSTGAGLSDAAAGSAAALPSRTMWDVDGDEDGQGGGDDGAGAESGVAVEKALEAMASRIIDEAVQAGKQASGDSGRRKKAAKPATDEDAFVLDSDEEMDATTVVRSGFADGDDAGAGGGAGSPSIYALVQGGESVDDGALPPLNETNLESSVRAEADRRSEGQRRLANKKKKKRKKKQRQQGAQA